MKYAQHRFKQRVPLLKNNEKQILVMRAHLNIFTKYLKDIWRKNNKNEDKTLLSFTKLSTFEEIF